MCWSDAYASPIAVCGKFLIKGSSAASEVPNDASADEQIVLAALVRGHTEFWDTRLEVSDFSAQTELTDEPHIQAPPNLEYASSVPTSCSCGISQCFRGSNRIRHQHSPKEKLPNRKKHSIAPQE